MLDYSLKSVHKDSAIANMVIHFDSLGQLNYISRLTLPARPYLVTRSVGVSISIDTSLESRCPERSGGLSYEHSSHAIKAWKAQTLSE